MCVLDLPQVCGGGDPAVFSAPQHAATLSLNNRCRCSVSSMPSQHPLNCGSFRIRHGYPPNVRDCLACTNAIRSHPPPQLRQLAAQWPFEQGRYDDGPLPPPNNPRQHANNSPFIPGLSSWTPTHNEAQSYHNDPATHFFNPSGAAAPHMSSPRPPQHSHVHFPGGPTAHLNPLTQQPPTPPMRPRSRSRNRNENQVAELNNLLEEALNQNTALSREN